ncbi:NhaP-type Na+/H+ or K+/H+ antiporter [Crossiella equi]|uniref:NhaP-type Na+/H+ or K+/H+ antiporter n=1 Tax=Crossiella equi TaxID=130796 RepID=A0ABS5A7Q6_9PSEU|nr:cation:proton antiporter [Crossiella equi]MBP2472619.1 NhaP-type Na+/H+ or K+/H+ antiporter [Crossiella equi]
MELILAVAGALALLAAVLPRLLHGRPLSAPLVLTLIGATSFLLPDAWLSFDPRPRLDLVVVVTELAVLVSVAGAGLKVNRPIGLRCWSSTWRLLGITLPVSVLAVTLLAMGVLGLPTASALLLAAALAPTDPVLAAEVQVPGPDEAELGSENEVRTTLTAEAGLNDALAMPFVLLAVLLASDPGGFGLGWVLQHGVWSPALGIAVGWACGKALHWLFFRVRHHAVRLGEHADGFVLLAVALLPYGLAELLGGLGFLAVFVAAFVVRGNADSHEYHEVLHDFGEQLEVLFVAALLTALGVAVGSGLLAGLTPGEVLVAVLVVLVVRPVLGGVVLLGGSAGPRAAGAIAFFGMRGIGTLYYLAFGLSHAEVPGADVLWRVVTLVILLSVVVHGLTAGPVMRALERRGAHQPRR